MIPVLPFETFTLYFSNFSDHPIEYQLWDAVLTLWVLGWMGWVPALAMDALWALPLCLAGIWVPAFYVHWRERAHAAHRLRCEWLA